MLLLLLLLLVLMILFQSAFPCETCLVALNKLLSLSLTDMYISTQTHNKCLIFRGFSCDQLHNNNNSDNNNSNHIQRRNSRFFTVSSLRSELSPIHTLKWPGRNRVQIVCNTLSAHHMLHVVLRAKWYEGTAQILSMTELKSHLF